MKAKLDLNNENKVVLMVVQALVGAVSPNFRRVAITFDEAMLRLLFVLERESEEDREEIEDVMGEFDALLLSLNEFRFEFNVDITISAGSLPVMDALSSRIVFGRREY